MTDAQRAERLYELMNELDELMTAEEVDTYPVLDHLEDLIEDLEQ